MRCGRWGWRGLGGLGLGLVCVELEGLWGTHAAGVGCLGAGGEHPGWVERRADRHTQHHPASCLRTQIVVGPPYDTCTSLHHDDAAALRVKKVVRLGGWLGRGTAPGLPPMNWLLCRPDGRGLTPPPATLCRQLDAERKRLQAS